jgi:glycosyltransferase involved in cell wall biosynthesis
MALIGPGQKLQQLRLLSQSLGNADDVLWLGTIPLAHGFFRAFDGLVLSSRTEGTPMVILEAAFAGVPIVATRVGEVAEVTGEDGAFLVDPDRPQRLAEALALTMEMPTGAAARAARARDRVVRHFSARPWAERHVQLYQDAICTARVGR